MEDVWYTYVSVNGARARAQHNRMLVRSAYFVLINCLASKRARALVPSRRHAGARAAAALVCVYVVRASEANRARVSISWRCAEPTPSLPRCTAARERYMCAYCMAPRLNVDTDAVRECLSVTMCTIYTL